VAQRTGAKRFLAPLAKSASAGAALALALAALLLSGCGGGSSDPEGSSSTDSSSSTAAGSSDTAAGPGAAGASSGSGSSAQAGAKAAGTSGADSATAAAGGPAGGSPGGGQKHGEPIAAPKGPTEVAPAPAEIAEATVADMSLQSPVITATAEGPGAIPAPYTCDGKDTWPQLRWAGVPPGTVELALFAMNVQPVEEHLFVDWAVAGLDPGLEGLEAGQLPKGAVVGTNSFGKRGYSICPPGGEIYMFAVYALPRSLDPRPGFDARELRKEVLGVSGNVGLLPAAYVRG
jgi:phosphatidylethanolamine-binding protein (PEBP) family uncharacterized protein